MGPTALWLFGSCGSLGWARGGVSTKRSYHLALLGLGGVAVVSTGFQSFGIRLSGCDEQRTSMTGVVVKDGYWPRMAWAIWIECKKNRIGGWSPSFVTYFRFCCPAMLFMSPLEFNFFADHGNSHILVLKQFKELFFFTALLLSSHHTLCSTHMSRRRYGFLD